ncbi:aminotransferase class I/II-fold pyridoxal phosphate-dependent enzyme [Flavobacterium sp. J49]|uniref:aminotransferase class I/II-fold pyridoxal phosphate-dependent enzyme n=1 Tax=Flavobacterium sp. J49 TaxID=2718534 RepID=UPI001593EB05|nr:aminotransferase class I/II-fold pyridoxal phosphate-dependent enzyme [Flavobacterium sp. J49]MBF6640003.1 aminotransferase class I/II-fold pyridoxal phosphate-dependent enzyme [Flavobacterium sp. J49]NIC01248.1 aminotransferase class I/II-fold pyridoxal phosphate-dependent enzyme [Flavobacterium sp. J49]
MSNSKIWLSSPHMGGSEQKYVQEAFDTNWVAPLGPNVTGFEQDLESYLGENVHVGALSSGTAALHLALILLGIKSGDEVICQSMTFSASANPIVYLGATPIFVDSEPETWNMCPTALEQAIQDRIAKGKKPKAIIGVHLYGMAFKVDEITAIAQHYDIPLVEDSAEALGSTYKGRKCGTFGDLSILSFNGNKIITTSGGGAIATKTLEQKNKAVFLSTQARDHAPHYQHSEIGYNYRMSNICAGIGRGQMEVLDKHIGLRRAMHEFYVDLFKNISGVTVFSEPNSDYFSNHWLSCIVIDAAKTNGITSEMIRLALEKENIECRPLWKPMHLQPVFQDCLYFGKSVAEDLFLKGLCLPSGSNLSEINRDTIRKTFLHYFKDKVC